MAVEKKENGRTVRVTIRISVPETDMAGVVALDGHLANLEKAFEGLTYDLSIASPRPER